jgi:hypothetical protein
MFDIERRDWFGGLLWAGFGALATGTGITQASAQDEKLAQSVVRYQNVPKDGQRCDHCVNWLAPRGCKLVAGTLSPSGWCVAFAAKDG